ncbi:MAG: hypothetical protein HUK25_05150 [Treponema sp.]|nr:hypothetical protein [Treponema sp.]
MIYIDNNKEWWIQCDLCKNGNKEVGPFNTKRDAINFKQNTTNGWKTIKLSCGGFIEKCPNC